MANDRLLGTVDLGKAPAYAGEMLFKNLEETRKREAEAKQLDVTEGIRSKYRMQEAAQGNAFNEGMTKLRAFLDQQATDISYQRTQEARQQAARHLQTMVGGAIGRGVPMPGLADYESVAGTPEASVPPAVSKIEPGAVDVAKDVFGKNLEAHFRAEEQRRGVSLEGEKKKLFEMLDVVDDDTARDAVSWRNRFIALGDPNTAALIEGYTKAGQGSKAGWLKTKESIIPQLMKANASNAMRMAIAQEISSRMKEIARIRTEAQRALANTKMDAQQYKNLSTLHDKIDQQLRGVQRAHQMLMEDLYENPGTPDQEAKKRSELRRLELLMPELQQQQTQISQRMAQWTPLSPGNPPGQAGPTAPGFGSIPNQADPLKIK